MNDASIHVYTEDDTVLLDAPEHPDLPAAATAAGGRKITVRPPAGPGDQPHIVWRFPADAEQAVRDLVVQIWGIPAHPASDPDRLTIRYAIPDSAHGAQDLWRCGRRLAWRPDRDAPVQLGEGVTVIAGRFADWGGSRARPAIDHTAGTVLQVDNVPAGHHHLSSDPNITVIGTPVDVGTPMLLSLAHPDRLGMYLRALLAGWAARQPNPDPAWLLPWDELGAAEREASTLAATALFRAGLESADAWAEGWDAAVAAMEFALDDIRAERRAPNAERP